MQARSARFRQDEREISGLFAKSAAAAAGALFLLNSAGQAATLTLVDFNAAPVPVNAVSVGDSGSQTVSPSLSYLSGYGYLFNGIYLTSASPDYFNYSIVYAPTTAALASTSVWTGTLNAATGWSSNGSFLAQADSVSVAGGGTLSVSGSFAISPGSTYELIAGLGTASFQPDGVFNLDWSVTSSARYAQVYFGSDVSLIPSVPELSTSAMLLIGLVGIGFASWRFSAGAAREGA